MGDGRYIGRVGALAVALGIGAAVASCTGTAWADSETNSSPPSSDNSASSSSDKSDSAATSGKDADASVSGPATDGEDDDETSVDLSAELDDDSEGLADDDETTESSSGAADVGDVVEQFDDPELTDAGEDLDEALARPEDSEQKSDKAAPVADEVTIDVDAAEQLPVTATSFDSSPEEPSGSSVLLALLAAARRQDSEGQTINLAVQSALPTVSRTRVGSPGWFSAKVTGRVYASDADRDKLTFTAANTARGTVTVNSRGSFTYTPTDTARHAAAATPGEDRDTFVVAVSDGNGGVIHTSVSVVIRPDNSRPNARSTVGKGNPATGVVLGTISASDRDGDVITFVGSGATPRGNVVVRADGSFVYTPTAAAREAASSPFRRSDRFTVTVNDGHGGTDTVTVRVRIATPDSNRAPTAGNPGYSITGVAESNGVVTGTVNITDPEGFALTFQLASGVDPNVGTVTVNATTGAFAFTPTAGARETAHGTPGADTVSFTVRASDGLASATVNVNAPVSPKAPAAPSNTLQSGQWLEAGKHLQSPNGRFRLYVQTDGNLVLYDEAQNHKALWATATNGKPSVRATMQTDGNLVLYSGSTGVWSSKTNGWNGARLVVQDDGNLVIYAGSTAVWDRHAGVLRNPPSTGGSFAQKVASFVSNNYGKSVANAAGTYLGECVSLVSQFLKQVHGITSGAWGNAVDWRSGGSGGAQMAARGFVWRSDQSFQNGDILVWGPGTYTGAAGHIGIWYSGKVFDQNSGWHRDVGVRQSGYSQFWSQGYLGYWRKP